MIFYIYSPCACKERAQHVHTGFFCLGFGAGSPWKVLDIKFDMEATPNRLDLRIGADRGAMYRCTECGELMRPSVPEGTTTSLRS